MTTLGPDLGFPPEAPSDRLAWYLHAEQVVSTTAAAAHEDAMLTSVPLTREPGEVLVSLWDGADAPLLPALETPFGHLFRRPVAEVAVAAINRDFRACESVLYAVWLGDCVAVMDCHLTGEPNYLCEIVRPSTTGHYALGDRVTWTRMDTPTH